MKMSSSISISSSSESQEDLDYGHFFDQQQLISGNDDDNDSDSDTYWDEEEDMDLQIEFLRRKSALLERACNAMREEDVYSASVARQETVEPEESPLWAEAKDVLRILYRGEAGPDLFKEEETASRKRRAQNAAPGNNGRGPPVERKSPKHPRIDLSSVKLIQKDYRTPWSEVMNNLDEYRHCFSPRSVVKGGEEDKGQQQEKPQRMSHLLNQKLSQLSFDDSETDLVGSMTLMQATALSSTPQLILNAETPFRIVHANKAFSLFSGIPCMDIMGKSMDAIMKPSGKKENNIKQQPRTGCDSYFDSTLDCSASQPSTSCVELNHTWIPKRVSVACRVHVVPIVDRSKLRCHHGRQTSVTHLLLQLEDGSRINSSSDRSHSNSTGNGLSPGSSSKVDAESNDDRGEKDSASGRSSTRSRTPPPSTKRIRRLELVG